jgi:hypothetical protein
MNIDVTSPGAIHRREGTVVCASRGHHRLGVDRGGSRSKMCLYNRLRVLEARRGALLTSLMKERFAWHLLAK